MNATDKKYLLPFIGFAAGYLVFNFASISGAFAGARAPGTWGLALVVSAPVFGLIWAHLSWMRHSDEFVRAVHAKRFIVAMGITMAIASAWGFLEIYANVPHISPALLLPVFYLAYGFISPFIRTSH